jgi:hypothetical protein
MFYIVFGDFFHRIPFIFILIVLNRIPILHFFSLRNLWSVKMDLIFLKLFFTETHQMSTRS